MSEKCFLFFFFECKTKLLVLHQLTFRARPGRLGRVEQYNQAGGKSFDGGGVVGVGKKVG